MPKSETLMVKGKNFYFQKIFANGLSFAEIKWEGEVKEPQQSKHYFQQGNNKGRSVFHFHFNLEYAMDINFGNVHVKEAKQLDDAQTKQDEEDAVDEEGDGSSPEGSKDKFVVGENGRSWFVIHGNFLI